MKKIRVMIVDDMLLFRTILSSVLIKDPSIEVVGAFGDPTEAIEKISELRPDVITVDMEMPKMRGDVFLGAMLSKYPHARAVVISSIGSNVFDAMQAGAIDFVGKPGSSPGYEKEQFEKDVIEKVKIAASADVQAHRRAVFSKVSVETATVKREPALCVNSKQLIAIGASTGGTEAILEVVRHFPAQAPGVVVVQHMPPGFTQMYAERADRVCKMSVREAKHGDRVEQGLMLIAPGGDRQLYVRRDSNGYFVSLKAESKVSGHCPSVDVLFSSVAETAGKNATGVLLTGMGADGAKGLQAMRKAGAHTVGQDAQSSVVYGMPKVAFEIGAVAEQLPLSQIGQAVLKRFS